MAVHPFFCVNYTIFLYLNKLIYSFMNNKIYLVGVLTNIGRINLMQKTDKFVYLMEYNR